MELQLFKTLWGHGGSLNKAAYQAVDAGFVGLEGNADMPQARRDEMQSILQTWGLRYIQEIVTAGGYVPRRQATVEEHIADVERQLQLGRSLEPQWVTVIGGCDAWQLEQSVRFFGEVQEVAARMNIECSFETHRSRSLFNPWTTIDILQRLPELQLTCDFSHWVVVMERQLDHDWDAVKEVARHARTFMPVSVMTKDRKYPTRPRRNMRVRLHRTSAIGKRSGRHSATTEILSPR